MTGNPCASAGPDPAGCGSRPPRWTGSGRRFPGGSLERSRPPVRRCGSFSWTKRARTSRRAALRSRTYADRPKSVPRALAFRQLLRPSGFPAEYQPDLFRFLDEFPRTPLEGAESILYWSREKFGLKPVISITHTVLRRRNGPRGFCVEADSSSAITSRRRSGWRFSCRARHALRIRHLHESIAGRGPPWNTRAAGPARRRPPRPRRARPGVDRRETQAGAKSGSITRETAWSQRESGHGRWVGSTGRFRRFSGCWRA